jgi:hypothetical protein
MIAMTEPRASGPKRLHFHKSGTAGSRRGGESSPATAPRSASIASSPSFRERTTATAGTPGRLIFALDATYSRDATWDTACKLQAEMFQAAASVGSLDLQLVYYRGPGECLTLDLDSAWRHSALNSIAARATP